jgi:hypothetical protein
MKFSGLPLPPVRSRQEVHAPETGSRKGLSVLDGNRRSAAFKLVAGVFLFPVALSYGVDPAATIAKFMNFTVEGTDRTHIAGGTSMRR